VPGAPPAKAGRYFSRHRTCVVELAQGLVVYLNQSIAAEVWLSPTVPAAEEEPGSIQLLHVDAAVPGVLGLEAPVHTVAVV
jgi:hypothetical protein